MPTIRQFKVRFEKRTLPDLRIEETFFISEKPETIKQWVERFSILAVLSDTVIKRYSQMPASWEYPETD
ncbi:MAG: hypothetical protein ACREBW_10420 [Candidatus Micrarchaeaceae archaeon]